MPIQDQINIQNNKYKNEMNKKIIIGGVVILAIGVVSYVVYKNMNKPTRKMFDEMVANCKSPCDVFQGLSSQKLDLMFIEYQKLSKKDAEFMRDVFLKPENEQPQANKDKFMSLWKQITKTINKK